MDAPGEMAFSAPRDPAVSVIVVAWGSSPHLFGCLASIAAQRAAPPFEVVLVLNHVEQKVVGAVASRVRGATVVASRSDLGFAGSVNAGVGSARAALFAVLHDDVEVPPDWLERLAGSAASHPEAEITGCRVLGGPDESATSPSAAPGATVDGPVDVSDCAFLVRRTVWDRLGGLDEIYYPFGFVTTDLCARVVGSGGHARVERRATVRRNRSGRMNDRFKSVVMGLNGELFATRHAVVPETSAPAAPAPSGARAPRRGGGESRLLVIDDAVPDPSFGAGSGRMAEVLRELAAGGRFTIDLLPLVARCDADPARAAALGVDVVEGDLEDLVGRGGRRYGAVIVSRPHNWVASIGTLRRRAPAVPVVYDAEALFSRRLARQAAYVTDAPTAIRVAHDAARLDAVEREIAREADYVVTICEDEADFFRDGSPDPANVVVRPPYLAGVSPSPAQLAARHDLGFVAGWSAGPDSPNADALEWFARKILPGVRARVPGARVRVTGIDPPANVRRLATPAVEFVGQVESLPDFYASVRVVVVPIRYGSGVKLKTVEAVQFGVPTVATQVGAEGISLDDRGAIVVVDDPERFARAVAALLADDEAWQAQRARVLAQQARWVAGAAGPVWVPLLERLTGSPPAGRSAR